MCLVPSILFEKLSVYQKFLFRNSDRVISCVENPVDVLLNFDLPALANKSLDEVSRASICARLMTLDLNLLRRSFLQLSLCDGLMSVYLLLLSLLDPLLLIFILLDDALLWMSNLSAFGETSLTGLSKPQKFTSTAGQEGLITTELLRLSLMYAVLRTSFQTRFALLSYFLLYLGEMKV